MVLYNATVFTLNGDRDVFASGAVRVEGERIAAVGGSAGEIAREGDELVDLRGRFLLPGFVNAHVHVVQQLARGLADDVDILVWLHERIWPYESHMSEEDAYCSTMLAGYEQIKNGVTTICDSGVHHAAATVDAIRDLGIRAQLCFSIMDEGEGLPQAWRLSVDEAMEKQREAYQSYHGAVDGKVDWFLGLRTLMNHSDELVRETKALADDLDGWIHMHIAEGLAEREIITASRGKTTVRHLADMGILSPKFLAAHAQGVDGEEIAILAEHGVKVAYCPSAAARVMGWSPIAEMSRAGIPIGVSTDGVPSNGRNSIMDELFFAGHIQRGRMAHAAAKPAPAVPADRLLEMITIEAAECVGLADRIGSIEPGKQADFVVVDPGGVEMIPVHDPIANLVYSLKTENVESTMCAGRWLMKDREIQVFDPQELIAEGVRRAAEITERAGVKLPLRYNWK